MGHYHTPVIVEAKTKSEAKSLAIDDFYYEHGHGHSIYGIDSITLIKKVPPIKTVARARKTGRITTTIYENVRDTDAPEAEWLGEYKVVIHSHF